MLKDRCRFSVVLFVIFVGGPRSVFAQGYCSSVSEVGLSFGCAESLSNTPILNNSPSPTNIYITQLTGAYDGLVWDADWIAGSSVEPRLRFSADVRFPDPMTQSWRNVFIGSTRTDGAQTDVTATALPFGNSGVDEHIDVTLQFDRLTLENTNAMVLPGTKNTNVLETGAIEYFILGSAANGSQGGGLTLNNAALAFNQNSLIGATQFLMAGPTGSVPFIRAEAGSNTLSIGSQPNFAERVTVSVDGGASLEFTGTEMSTRIEGNLNIAAGGRLSLINNSVLSLLQNDSTQLPRTSVTGGSIDLDGINTELLLTAPEIIDGGINLKNGATLTIRERDTGSSSISFSGDNLITLDGPQTSIRGNADAPDELMLEIGAGTTRFVGAVAPTLGRGLNVNAISIDGGTLDWDDMVTNNAQQDAIESIAIANGGVFQERSSRFGQLEGLVVSDGTLRTHGVLGSYTVNNGINSADFTDSVIDVMGASSIQPGVSAGLRATVINANHLSFSGRNRVEIGISPVGECFLSAGACIPGSTRYAGQLVTNVGNDPQANLSGYDRLLFVPHAVNTTATAADYIGGGVNGRYTVATANSSGALTTHLQGFDAAPMTPTAADLSAAGTNLPANLIYTIVNDPVADGRVDIAFHDVGLTNHPQVATGYTPQFTNTVLIEPDTSNTQAITVSVLPDPVGTDPSVWTVVEPETSNVTTITQTVQVDPDTGVGTQEITTVVTEPDGTQLAEETVSVPLDTIGGGATQVITTTTTEPSGAHVWTTSVVVPLDPATGTPNTSRFGNLMTAGGGTLTHGTLSTVATLHPEAYASYMTVALEHSDHLRNMVLSNAMGRVYGDGRASETLRSGRRIWLDAGVMQGSVSPSGYLSGFDYNLNQLVGGMDLINTGKATLGVYAGYGAYSFGSHEFASSVDVDTDAYHVGLYGSREWANWSLTGMAGVSWGTTKGRRGVVLAGVSEEHRATFDSQAIAAGIRAEYRGLPSVGAWRLAPEFGLGYTHYEQNGFVENGAGATALRIQDAQTESLVASVGLNLAGPTSGAGLAPLAFIRYEHDFLASDQQVHNITAALAATPGITQSFIGTHRGADALSLGLGLAIMESHSVDASAGVVYTKNTHGEEVGGGLRVTWRF